MPCSRPRGHTVAVCRQEQPLPSPQQLPALRGQSCWLRLEESQPQSQRGCLGPARQGGHCCPLRRRRWNKEPSFWLRLLGESSSAALPACITSTRSESKTVLSLRNSRGQDTR